MKYFKILLTCVCLFGVQNSFAQGSHGVYELRTYLTNDGKLDNLHARFQNHTIPLFNKHGMESIGYWTPVDTDNTLIYIIKHKSVADAKQSWQNFANDPEWKVVAEETNRNGAILAKSPDSVFMTATEYSMIK